MNNYVYILTDTNRKHLHIGLTDNFRNTAKTHGELRNLLLDVFSNASRLVYYEVLANEAEALRRFNELSGYTRMQKERLIRRQNPNWLNLSTPTATTRIERVNYTPYRQFASTWAI